MRESSESFADTDKLLDLRAQNRFHVPDAITLSVETSLAKPLAENEILAGGIDASGIQERW